MIQQNEKTLFKKATMLALFLAPIIYISQILAVAIHEIMGHGLTALLLGGEFQGFVIRLDSLGFAYFILPTDATKMDYIAVLSSGVVSNIVMGIIFLFLAYVVRRKLILRLSLLVLSFLLILEGTSYVFWNSYRPVPPGDIGRILMLWRGYQFAGSEMRMPILLAALSGILFFAGTLFMCALLFQGIEEALRAGKRFSPKERFMILLIFLALPGSLMWFIFDWNQLVPGIGLKPCITGAGSILISAAVLYRISLKPCSDAQSINIKWYHLFFSYACLFILVALIFFWFQNGVMWS